MKKKSKTLTKQKNILRPFFLTTKGVYMLLNLEKRFRKLAGNTNEKIEKDSG